MVRGVHLAVYSVAAQGDDALRHTLVRTAVPVGTAAILLVVGAVLGGVAQTALWLLALAVDYVGIYAPAPSGAYRRRRTSPSGTG